MMVDLPPHVTTAESMTWTYWSSRKDAAAALGYPVARLPDPEPVAIGSPVAAGSKPLHVWLRYQDAEGLMYGVVTLPWPSDVTTDATSAIAVATAIAIMLRSPELPEPTSAADAQGPILLDSIWYPAATVTVGPRAYARAVILPTGHAVVVWGSEQHLGRVHIKY